MITGQDVGSIQQLINAGYPEVKFDVEVCKETKHQGDHYNFLFK
jgi:hypothetical protein